MSSEKSSPIKRRPRPGQPPFEPTEADRELVRTMAASGIPQVNIARCIRGGIDPKTLRKNFRDELDTSALLANNEVAKTLYQKAIAGDTTAMIWWTKTRMRWSERHEITGEDGGPINVKVNFE